MQGFSYETYWQAHHENRRRMWFLNQQPSFDPVVNGDPHSVAESEDDSTSDVFRSINSVLDIRDDNDRIHYVIERVKETGFDADRIAVLIKATAEAFGATQALILSRDRGKIVDEARAATSFLLYTVLNLNLSIISRIIARDRKSVRNAINRLTPKYATTMSKWESWLELSRNHQCVWEGEKKMFDTDEQRVDHVVSVILDGPKDLVAVRLRALAAQAWDFSTGEIVGPSREGELSWARQCLMFLMRRVIGLSHNHIGMMVGGRHPTTVLAAITKVERKLGPVLDKWMPQIYAKFPGVAMAETRELVATNSANKRRRAIAAKSSESQPHHRNDDGLRAA